MTRILALALLLGPPVCCCAAEAPVTRVSFRETDTLFANPGQGWMGGRHFTNSVRYLRFNWADVEPERGRYDWSRIDGTLSSARSNGATVAFRVMTCNAHSAGYYASPKWLFDAGCKGFEYLRGGDDPTSGGKRIPRIEPDYADPLYRRAHGEFLAAWGRRYDGNAGVEFLDIGSYGIWGEWHTSHPAPVEIRKQIVDEYLAAFPKTWKVFMSDDAEVLNHALARGTGFRRDGVGSPWHEANWIGSKKYAGVQGMADAWKHAPVVFEWFGDYDYLRSRGWSFDAAVNFMLSNHVTLINDNIGRVPPEALPQLEKLARLAGARFVVREAEHETSVRRDGALTLRLRGANVGVGKLHHPYTLRWFLVEAGGRTAGSMDSKADPRGWLPGGFDVAEKLELPKGLTAGSYTLALAMVDPSGSRRNFRLAIDAPVSDGRHAISRLVVE